MLMPCPQSKAQTFAGRSTEGKKSCSTTSSARPGLAKGLRGAPKKTPKTGKAVSETPVEGQVTPLISPSPCQLPGHQNSQRGQVQHEQGIELTGPSWRPVLREWVRWFVPHRGPWISVPMPASLEKPGRTPIRMNSAKWHAKRRLSPKMASVYQLKGGLRNFAGKLVINSQGWSSPDTAYHNRPNAQRGRGPRVGFVMLLPSNTRAGR